MAPPRRLNSHAAAPGLRASPPTTPVWGFAAAVLLVLSACGGSGGGDDGSDSDSGSGPNPTPTPIGNRAPSAGPVSQIVDRGVSTPIALAGSDPDGDALSYRIVDEPTHGVVQILADGTVVYTSANGYFGDDAFTYLADDGSATSAPAAVNVAVDRNLDPALQLISGAWLPAPMPNNDYEDLSASADGRWVTFTSIDPSLVPGFETLRYELYLLDRDSGAISRVVEGMDGGPADGESLGGAISGDGRWIAFLSAATDLVPGDDEGEVDVFLLDRESGAITRLSEAADGTGGDAGSREVAISHDGGLVAFSSRASNLVAGDSNGVNDVFVYAAATGDLRRVSVDSTGTEGDGDSRRPVIATQGLAPVVVFESTASNLIAGDSNGVTDVFLHDLTAQTTILVSVDDAGIQGDDASEDASVSADGRRVAFQSRATNLVAGDSNGETDVFVRDVLAGTVQRVSVALDGIQGDDFSGRPQISADGTSVLFESSATTFVSNEDAGARDLYLTYVLSPGLTLVSLGATGQDNSALPEAAVFLASSEIAFIAYSGLDPFLPGVARGEQLFVRDIFEVGSEVLVPAHPFPFGTLNTSGREWDVSDDGRYVIHLTDFPGQAPGDDDWAKDIILLDRDTGVPRLIDTGAMDSFQAAISDDGSVIAFASRDPTLVPGDGNDLRDIFVYEIATGTVERVSLGPGGAEADGDSAAPVLSADGRFVAFESVASNLVAADTGGRRNIFLHDRDTGTTELISVGFDGNPVPSGVSRNPSISEDGAVVAFQSDAGLIIFADSNGQTDVFVRDRGAGTTVRASEPEGAGITLDGPSSRPELSADGRRVAFQSFASNLVAGDTNGRSDVFVRDLDAGTTIRVSVDDAGTQADFGAVSPTISDDGTLVAFHSSSTNLVPGDSNDQEDVFLRDLTAGTTRRLSIGPAGQEIPAESYSPVISGDGSVVLFRTSPAAVLPEIPAGLEFLDAIVLRVVEPLGPG